MLLIIWFLGDYLYWFYNEMYFFRTNSVLHGSGHEVLCHG